MQKMSCEQIYNVWISEPNLIRIVDLRDRKSYEKRHIPGAILASQESLRQVILENRNRLLVFFGTEEASEALAHMAIGSEAVLVDKPLEWFEKKWPSAGTSRPIQGRAESSDSSVVLETLLHPATGAKAWMLIDPLAKEVSCVNAHEAVVDRWKALQREHYQLQFVMRTHGSAQPLDFRLTEETRARICVPSVNATADVDIPLEQGQEIEFGDRVIRITSVKDSAGQEFLEFDFCGKHRVGGIDTELR